MEKVQDVLSLVIGLSGAIGGLALWYKSSIEKRYAAERAFNHIQKHYEGLSHQLVLQDQSLEQIDRTLIEMKGTQNGIYNSVERLAARVDSSTSGWQRPNLQ